MDTLKELLNKILSEVADKGYRYSVALKVMMVTVVFVTTYMLILPAITLEVDKAAAQGGIDVPGIEKTAEQADEQGVDDSDGVSADVPEEESVSDSDVDTSAEDPDAEDAEADNEQADELNEDEVTEVTEEDVESEPESESPKLTFEGRGFTVDVEDPQGVLPEETELSVSEITSDDKKYDKYCSDAIAALKDNTETGSESEPGFVRLYDIKLIAGDDVIEPEDSVEVTITYDNEHKSNSGENALRIENEDNVYVVHFKEDEDTGKEQAEVLDKETTSFHIRRKQLEEATFEADSFSVYAIVDLPETTASTLDVIGEKGSEGFQISIKTGNGAPSSSAKYYMTGKLVHNVSGNSDRDGIDAKSYSTETIPEVAEKYYFERINDTNQFYIYKKEGSEKKYIQMTPVSANVARAGLTFAENEEDRTAFSLINETQGRFQISAKITTTAGAQKTYYWVRNTKDPGNGAIIGYENKSDTNTAWVGLHQEGAFTDPYGLDDKSYSLLIWDGGKTGKALTGDANGDYSGDLCADFLTVMTKTGDSSDKLYVPDNTADTVSSWKFSWINNDLYKLSTDVNGTTKYLKIDANGLTMVDNPDDASDIQVIPGTGIHKGQIILKSGNYVLTYSGEFAKGFNTNAGTGKEYLYLAEAKDESLLEDYYRTYSATKISVSDPSLTPESPDDKPKKIIIYTRVWNGSGYTYFAIDGEGKLVPCYERGDSIEWIGSTLDELQWEFTVHGSWSGDSFTPNYYYDLQNAYTLKWLAPQREGKDGKPAQILSDDAIGLNMSGRRNGQYYTPILAWDTDNYSYTSINVDLEEGAGATIEECISRDGLDFYFATVDEIPVDDTLHTVSTVDNDQFGIKMRLVNFDNRQQMSSFLGNDEGGMTTNLEQGLLSTKLGEDDYPTAVGGSLGDLFNGNDPQDVNYLFTDSTFRATGYYEYDSAQNYAHLITDDDDPWIGQDSPNGGTYKKGDFVVYQELGSYDESPKYSLKHGQFFPFNDLKPGVFASVNGRNLYTPTGKKLDESDPRFNEQLYMIENTDCFFGTELTASFEQTPSGLDAWGHDIIFEFSGDDDFWLYVDEELTIDLGGIHSAVPGSVNFRTGEVVVNKEHTTLLDIFIKNKVDRGDYANYDEARAALLDNDSTGKFVTKTDPDDSTKEYYVFKDNTPHTMRIFYMERGAGASNLHMRFNLAAVKKGTVQLTKQLSNVDDAGANATAYPYQIFYKNPTNNQWEQFTDENMGSTSGGSVKYKGSVNDVDYKKDYHIDHEKEGVTYRAKYKDVFLLPAGETAEITFPTFGPNGDEKYVTDYYIVECGVDPEIYHSVKVDDVEIAGDRKLTDIKVVDGQEVELRNPVDSGLLDYSINYSTLEDRPRVTYDNEVEETKSINIIKELYKNENGHRERINLYDESGEPIDPDNPDLKRVFEFRLKLKAPNSDDDAWKNSIIYYHVKNPKGEYCKWDKDEGKLISTGKTNFDDLTEAEKILATFESSESGAMSNIPAYYSVEVNGMIPGTEYQVVERPNETPAGYQFWRYKAGTKVTPDGYDPLKGIKGSITTNDDTSVFICNDKGYELLLEKEWADAATIENRDPSYFAVYYEVRDPDTGAITRTLIDNSVKQLIYNAKPQELDWWYLNLPEISGVDDPKFGQFVVYEVTGTFTVNDQGVVTNSQNVEPVLDGGVLSLKGKPLGGSVTTIVYKATYDDPKTTGDNVREFKVTNTPSEEPSVKFLKEDWSGKPLQNAEFTLKLGSDTVFDKTSNEQGLISTEFLSNDTDYILEEIKAPQGYYGLQETLTVRLVADGEEGWTLQVTPHTGDITEYYDVDFDQENNCVTLTIKNHPYAFEAIKVDGTDNSIKVEGAVFTLYEQVYVDGKYDWRIKEWGGQPDLTTDTHGVIPHVDSSLPAGTYQLREVTPAGGYTLINGNIDFTVSQQGSITLGNHPANVELSGPTEGTGEQAGKLVYTLTIPNDPKPIRLRKVDRSSGNPLLGAVFQLTKKKEGARGGDGHQIWEAFPENNGIIDMTNADEVDLPILPSGYYRLEEMDAPEGHVILEDYIYFHIKDDRTVELCDKEGNPFPETQIPAYELLTGNKTDGYKIIAKDSVGTELPMTGGIGTHILYIIGVMLIAVSAAGMARTKRAIWKK